ncbi:MAG: PEP-CTERM sorting domain-containing protein [Phycisphaerales bacterium]
MKTRLLAVATVCACAGMAHAIRVDLGVYENASNASLSGIDLWVDVLDAPGPAIDFVFHNDSTASSFITAVYFETGLAGLSGGSIVDQSTGVSFNMGATPPNPAQPGFLFGGSWGGNLVSLDADNPSPTWGINEGGLETLTVRLNASGINANGVAAAMLADPREFRIAQHVQGLENGAFSVWSVTPAPGSLALLGLGGLAAGRRRR